jgi:hypothetical protein
MPVYSPVLGLVTGVLELAAGAYVSSSPGRRTVLRPVAAILFLLAGYQFAEIAVCARPDVLVLSRAAYLIITWLPPLGLRLAAYLDARKIRALKPVSLVYFAAAGVLSVWILAAPDVIARSVCELVLARYSPSRPFDIVYALFYQTGLLAVVFGSGLALAKADDAVLRKHLAHLQLGVLGFIFPSLAVRLLFAGRPGDLLPSVMCHFAFTLAASLFALALRERRAATQTGGPGSPGR